MNKDPLLVSPLCASQGGESISPPPEGWTFSIGELASGHRAEPSPVRLARTVPFPSVVPAKAGTQNVFEGLVWRAGTKAGFPPRFTIHRGDVLSRERHWGTKLWLQASVGRVLLDVPRPALPLKMSNLKTCKRGGVLVSFCLKTSFSIF